jgi:hypothetical protein
LGDALQRFGHDFETVRTGDLLIGRQRTKSSAARLVAAARRAEESVRQHALPLAHVLDRIVAIAEPLAVEQADLSGEPGRKAVAALAGTYLRFGRYLEAVATVREGWVNFYASRAALSPGAPDFDKQARDRAEECANSDQQYHDEIAGPRNDLLHAQYRRGAQNGRRIISKVGELVRKFTNADRPLPEQLSYRSGNLDRGVLINLTNHPKSAWEEAQQAAASALAECVQDLKFPAVPPDADEARVGEIAQACVAQIPAGATHALVQGEFTLTAELVRRLQARGIVCLAATSAREVDEAEAGRRTTVFKFARFRRYPQLRPG